MSGFARRHVLAVVTILALASFQATGAEDAPGAAFRDNPAWTVSDGALTTQGPAEGRGLVTRLTLADSVTSFEYRAPAGASATLYLMGRYGFDLEGNGEWRSFSVKFRAPRFDDGYNKLQPGLVLEMHHDADIKRNVLVEGPSEGAIWQGEDKRGPAFIVVKSGPFSVRKSSHDAADFEQVTLPKVSGGDTNEKALEDLVAMGRELFTQVGCEACHRVDADDAGVSTGPNLYGLFRREPRNREVAEAEGRRFQIKAGREYLHRSMRAPADQLAVAERGETRGQPYLPLMPAFSTELLSDAQIDAIGDYLATLNTGADRGPVIRLASLAAAEPYDPMKDSLQWLVADTVRLQRGPMVGTSGRAIHVGLPNGVNYSFDPRVLAIVKIWQGGFLAMEGELTNRGGRGLGLGYESREIGFDGHEYLLAPLDAAGKPVDFTFKEAKFGDQAAEKAALYSKEDQLAQIAAVDAQFLGYSRNSKDKAAAPSFKYRVGKNVVEVATIFETDGNAAIKVRGTLTSDQAFALNTSLLRTASASSGTLADGRWVLPAGKVDATLKGTIGLAANAWRPVPSNYAWQRQPLEKGAAQAQLPAGYSIENWYAPNDNYGRKQLFEALGLSVTKDGTVVVATRNAGIWRLVKGEWQFFAEGLFDSLGVVAEDAKGLVVVAGQKAELTRISDTNGDGVADKYETLYDAHSYHGNYHSYMHGPVRGKDGAYYFALNLVHDGSGTAYMGGGNVMGTYGGFNGWAFRVDRNGKGGPFANGLRSPASLGVGPDGRVWYADNQGDFVATSKLFVLEKDHFYGHPAGLVDLPGMTPDSPDIQYDAVADKREKATVLFPHNKVANSPGNPAWVTQPKFGPFVGQMLIGDQTQSNLLRVVTEEVSGQGQGSVMPFFEGLESGVMRPVFLPDGSLLLGQTGRGWQAKGGKVASLQHVRWDGKTVAPAISSVSATSSGFRIGLTQPLGNGVSAELLRNALALESWTYRDAPDYGSPELDTRHEAAAGIAVSADRRSIDITLADLQIPRVHPRQTARVYHFKLAAATLFDANAPKDMHAYYTLYAFPARKP
ncbi:MAG TPA: c-type cytochrome [Steroidobacteraceae bacterium]